MCAGAGESDAARPIPAWLAPLLAKYARLRPIEREDVVDFSALCDSVLLAIGAPTRDRFWILVDHSGDTGFAALVQFRDVATAVVNDFGIMNVFSHANLVDVAEAGDEFVQYLFGGSLGAFISRGIDNPAILDRALNEHFWVACIDGATGADCHVVAKHVEMQLFPGELAPMHLAGTRLIG